MQLAASPDRSSPRQIAPAARAAVEIVLIFLVFFIYGAWPAPGVNEPHYLSKARHYWDPSWCADDFFCNSADAHQVFYWTFGWLSRWLTFPELAWCGRLLTWYLLALAWRRLSFALMPAAWYAVLSAALMVVLNDRCQMAGEWIIGGVEAKGFAYVLVFFGLGSLVQGRFASAVLWLGAASAFHVIVGGWAVVAAALAWLVTPDRPPFRKLVLPLAGGLVLASAGLLPALALTRSVDAETVAQANRIYVFERLYHHLVPQQFPTWFVVRHLVLVAVLVLLARVGPSDRPFRILRAFVAGAVGIAALGFAIALLTESRPDLSAAILRYYWFRLSDVMVPVGTSLLAVGLLSRRQLLRPRAHAAGLVAALALVGVSLGQTVWNRREHLVPPADARVGNLAAWREICIWIDDNTPPNSVFLTPRLAQTFRWYSNRAEVVSRKDIPQDARGIVEWWRRMNRIHATEPGSAHPWRDSLAELGSERLRELGREFGAQFVITSAYPALNLERVGPLSPSFAIYRLDSVPNTQPAGKPGGSSR